MLLLLLMKNAYRLIGRMYYNIVVLYEQLKETLTIDSQILSNIENLQLEAYNNFHYWIQKAIYILPGGWNRFPEWENIYSEYILLTARCLEIYPEDEVVDKIIYITQKMEVQIIIWQKHVEFQIIPKSFIGSISSLNK